MDAGKIQSISEFFERKTAQLAEHDDGNRDRRQYDADYPGDDAKQRDLVAQLLVAMKNMTNIMEKPGNRNLKKVMAASDEALEMIAWEVLVSCTRISLTSLMGAL